ncbi:glycosyltransferase family 4 protein [Fibrella sp. HMF5335]|uniref:Glycosyltransferase family 4 protein n=1 Tax=Fibrella rubiginis TaxID=2817060 RepID=A0A939GDD0_9BACT|nr:glycosyltransferase family 4 protein [Fibrella rubiginis]MBO0936286.1 glycosyltransferase family 4 protein [Fibrella rubiginis]
MRVLAIHNVLWSHYKAAVYRRLYTHAQTSQDFTFHVLQIASTEPGRTELGEVDLSQHQYSFDLLFNTSSDNIRLVDRTRTLLRHVRRYRPDLILLNGYYDPASWVVLAYARLKGIAVLSEVETTAVSRRRVWWKELIKPIYVSQCAGFLCLGSAARSYVLQLGAPAQKVLTIRNIGVDNEALDKLYRQALPSREAAKAHLQLPRYNFIFAGRFAPEKNLLLLIQAFAELKRTSPDAAEWGLILSGNGSQRADLETFVRANTVPDVRMLPPCDWHEVPGRYTLADVMVLPSLFEPFGFAVNEAMIYGMPMLVSQRCGSVPDLLRDGVNGYTFDPENRADLVAKMRLMIQAKDQFAAMGEVSRQLITYFSPEAVHRDLVASINRFNHRIKQPAP